MKTKNLIWVAALVLAVSCNRSELVGLCHDPIFENDFPGLVLEPQAQSTVVETDNVFWWESVYVIDSAGDWAIVRPESPGRIEYGWITVEKVDEDSKALRITVEENTTGKDREVEIDLEAGNCFANFTVTQKAAE